MGEQICAFEQLEPFHASSSARQISQEPERIEDEVFVRICTGCDKIGIGPLSTMLHPLLKKLIPATGDDGRRPQLKMIEKGNTLKEIISEVLARLEDFESLDQYIWLVKFSCSLCLLKDLPIGMSFEINKVIRSVAGLDTEEYESDPVMIHTVAKSLFEEIPLRGMNLVHVIKKLAVLNQKLFYYVSIALIFAGLRSYSQPGEPIAMYRLYGFDEIIAKLDALQINNVKQELDLRKLFLILKLLSCYQNAVILRHSVCSWEDIQEQHSCFAECFRFSPEQKKLFTQWLCMARNVVTNLNSKSGMNEIGLKEDFLLVIQLKTPQRTGSSWPSEPNNFLGLKKSIAALHKDVAFFKKCLKYSITPKCGQIKSSVPAQTVRRMETELSKDCIKRKYIELDSKTLKCYALHLELAKEYPVKFQEFCNGLQATPKTV